MAVPFIQLGQCGNQVGEAFFDRMFQEGCKASPGHQAMLSYFFDESPKGNIAKAFLIDMEPKVVNKNLSTQRAWRYNKDYSIVKQQGSGNNWAYGCRQHGPLVKEGILNRIRKMFEEEDYVKCLFQIQSLAGGTGSGLGTYIMQQLGQNFPKLQKINICIMPHLSGEVIVQAYNAVLSISTLYQESDGIIIIENDRIQQICNKEFKLEKPSLQDINGIIGRQLASVFFPVIDRRLERVYSVQQNGFKYSSDLIRNLLYDPRFKLLNLKTAPNMPKNSESFNYDSWQAIENDIFSKYGKLESKASMLIARGPDHPDTFSNSNCYVLDSHAYGGHHRSATLIDNSQLFVDPFEKIITRCTSMLSQNAYVYQYQKHGLSKQQFIDQLAVMEGIQQYYANMRKE